MGCDQKSGRVVKVDLREAITFRGRNYTRRTTAREVDSSLKELQHLSYVDLSGTDFNGSQIPKFFGSMTRLKYLNLSYANFGGRIYQNIICVSFICLFYILFSLSDFISFAEVYKASHVSLVYKK